jgi:hypothetical protein
MQRNQSKGGRVPGSELAGRHASWSSAPETRCDPETDPVTHLLRLLTLLANCGLSAGAPPVLQAQRQS